MALPRFGRLEPRHTFCMNPFPERRFNECVACNRKTGQRKLPLLIHVDPHHLIALNFTCRYCNACDLLIARKDEIEHCLTETFRSMAPQSIGNDYLVIGTVEHSVWQRNIKNPLPPSEMLDHVHDFVHVSTVRRSAGGWFPPGVEPPEAEPPPSREWVRTQR